MKTTGKVLRALATFAAKERMRFALNSVRVFQWEGKACISATNGWIAALIDTRQDASGDSSIPADVIDRLMDSDEVEIADGVLTIVRYGAAFKVPPEGSYPRIHDVMVSPTGAPKVLHLSPEALRCAARIAEGLGVTSPVKVSVGSGEAAYFEESTEFGTLRVAMMPVSVA